MTRLLIATLAFGARPSTTAACGPDSLDTIYIDGLGKTTLYVLEEDKLILTQGDQGTMTFQ